MVCSSSSSSSTRGGRIIASSAADRFGSRLTAVIGSLLSALGYGLMALCAFGGLPQTPAVLGACFWCAAAAGLCDAVLRAPVLASRP